MTSVVQSLINRRLSMRVLDNADLTAELTGRIARVATEKDFEFRLPRGNPTPIAILVKLENPIKTSPCQDCPVSVFEFALLMCWDRERLATFAAHKNTFLSSSVHFYLLKEEMLRHAGISPLRDDMDIKMTYGISKDVEISLIPD